jgi:hypothetical protein
MDRLTEKLKMLQNIVPDDGFAFSTRLSVLTSTKSVSRARIVVPGIWASSAVMAAVVLVVVIITNIQSPSVARSVSEITAIDSIAESFEKDIDITLKEIRSYGESASKTSVALYEASSNGPSHINSSIIKKEFDTLNINIPDPEEVNKLLEQALF